jgi:tape measure domain-containing protein
MALYQVDVSVHTDSAERSIKNLRKGIEGITTEFEKAEIGAEEFIARASDLSKLNKELKDARGAVANIDKAYSDLDKALASMQRAYGSASQGAAKYHKDLLRIAEESYKEEDRLLKQRMAAERKAFDERLQMAIVETRAEQRRSKAIADFNAGMGARGAVPAVSSPVRGGASQFGSPAYFDALNKDLAQAINEGRQLDAEIAQAAESRQQAIANFLSGMGAKGAVPAAASSVQGSVRQTGSPAYFDALNKDLREAIAEGRQIDAEIKRAADSRAQALAEFRAGMGAKGAIPLIASPIRGGIEYGPTKGGKGIPSSPGSPAYLEAIGQAAKTAKTIKPSPDAFRPNSLADYENRLKVLQKEARLISPDSNRWRELNKEILKAEKGIQKIQKRQSIGPSAGQRVGAAGGAFLYGGGLGGGIASAVGGVAGGLAGGVPGAFAGAAIGQVADNLGTALAGITSQASAVQRIQRGLAMASVDAKDFAQAQAAVGEMSQKLLIPLEQTSKFFTQLRANTKEYNLSVDETRQILEGTVLAIMATGGSAEDLDGAMRAVVQIMSKGGVQAEELRGQLGERFPGAVVKFAQANKLSFEQLQDGLEKGTIGIKEFINFAKKNYADYGKFSEQLATAPEYAGQRLAIALEQVSLEVGSLFGPMGAEIQDGFTAALKGIAQFVKENRVILGQMIRDFGAIIVPILKVFGELLKILGSFAFEVAKVFTSLFSQIRKAVGMASIGAAKVRLDKAKAATAGKTREAPARQESVVDLLTGRTVFKEVKDLFGINSPFQELDAAQRQFNDLGGMAAYAQANKPVGPSNLTFGGTGAGMSMDRAGKEDKKKKEDSLENFERLRDQLANAYNQAEIERIKARYELEKRLREDLYDMQEFGANRLQRQNLQFLRALAKTEQERQDVAFNGQLSIAAAAKSTSEEGSGSGSGNGNDGGKAIFGDTGRTFNAPGWVHGHFQNMDREALVKDTVEVVMGLLQQGSAAELSSGAPFKQGMSRSQVERLVRQGIGSHKQYASGASAIDVFVPKGTKVPAPLSGVGNLGGNAGVTGRLSRGSQLMHLDPRSASGGTMRPVVGAGAPRKVGSNENRDTRTVANTGIAQENAALADRGALLIKESSIVRELGRYMQEVYNVPDLTLDNQLLKERNDLIEQGADENIINYKMRLLELDLQYQGLLKALPSFAEKAKLSTAQRIVLEAELAKGLKASKDAEKIKTDETLRNIEVTKQRETAKYIKSLQDEVKILLIIGDEERRLAEIQSQYGNAKAQEIFDLETIKKNIAETRSLIDGFVSSTTGDYKGFLKAVISGEDAADALKKFQEGLKDKVLTIFFDFAMAPVDKFLKEGLEGLLLPKGIQQKAGELPNDISKDPVQATNGNTSAIVRNTTALESVTAALVGQPSPLGRAATTAPTLGGQTTPTSLPSSAMVFGGDSAAVYNNMRIPDISKMFDGIDFEAAFDPVRTNFVVTLENLSSTLNASTSELSQSAENYSANFKSVGDSASDMAKKAGETAEEAKNNGDKLKESLGKVASGVGIAVGSIMGIAAGISQVKKGGTGNTLMGIGSVLASVGGAVGGFSNLFKPKAAANGALWAGGFQAFANGGMVKGPTLGLVGEGKYNEAIVPLPDGRSIPVQMRGGPGGESSRDLLAAQAQSRSSPSVLSMSFQSTTINGVEYVDRAQLEMAMAETRRVASRDGAARGANLAIDRLANSPSSRRRAGIR